MGIAIVFVIIFGLIIIGGIYFLLSQKKKAEKQMNEQGIVVSSKEKNTASELPFKDINQSMIDMGDDRYRMVVECGSINLNLKTNEEKEVVDMSFQRMLQGLNFPYAFYVQTREIDNREMIDNTIKEAERTIRLFPGLRDYANAYVSNLQGLNETIGNSKYKKKYIIITYNDIDKLDNIQADERKAYAFEELYNRCSSTIYSLANIGIKAHILNTQELAEMVFRAYNKEYDGALEGILSGDMLATIVDGKEHYTNLPKEAQLDVIINELYRALETEIIGDASTPTAFVDAANETIEAVEKIRNKTGGYYKSTLNDSDYVTEEDDISFDL
ncbi:MAG: hypothetical protein RSB38_06210 [Oscillospiraceae bacterium]